LLRLCGSASHRHDDDDGTREHHDRHPLIQPQTTGVVRGIDAESFDEESKCRVSGDVERKQSTRTHWYTSIEGDERKAQ
jgi:hypothetical protein